ALVVRRRLVCSSPQICRARQSQGSHRSVRHPDKENRSRSTRDQRTLSLARGVLAAFHGHLHCTRENLEEHDRYTGRTPDNARTATPPLHRDKTALLSAT